MSLHQAIELCQDSTSLFKRKLDFFKLTRRCDYRRARSRDCLLPEGQGFNGAKSRGMAGRTRSRCFDARCPPDTLELNLPVNNKRTTLNDPFSMIALSI
jgi:hypothetical protein